MHSAIVSALSATALACACGTGSGERRPVDDDVVAFDIDAFEVEAREELTVVVTAALLLVVGADLARDAHGRQNQ